MDTWKRRTDLRMEIWVGVLEEISQRTYMCICKAHGHRLQCMKARGVWGCGGEEKWGRNGGHL